jgi:hypothetical protein
VRESKVLAAEPHSDVTRVIPELAEIRARTAARDYPGLSAALLTLHDRHDTLLAAGLQVAVEEPVLHDLALERLRAQPDDILARALLAHSLIARGWTIRTGDRAQHVSEEQFKRFHDQLRDAEGVLIELCALEPGWTLPWYLRLITGRGLELGVSECRRRYDRLAEMDHEHYPAQAQLLQTLCPKWSGTWEDAFAFAHSCANAAPAGSPSHGLVADVHLEHWLSLGPQERVGYLRTPHVLRELKTAAAASVFHADYRPGFSWVRQYTAFAALFALAGDTDSAARLFAALGEVVEAGVWDYVRSDHQVLRAVRHKALTRAGAR